MSPFGLHHSDAGGWPPFVRPFPVAIWSLRQRGWFQSLISEDFTSSYISSLICTFFSLTNFRDLDRPLVQRKQKGKTRFPGCWDPVGSHCGKQKRSHDDSLSHSAVCRIINTGPWSGWSGVCKNCFFGDIDGEFIGHIRGYKMYLRWRVHWTH